MIIGQQNIGCSQGDSFSFDIAMVANEDNTAPDLTGATASWSLAESWIAGAPIYVTKATGNGVFINNDAGTWKITVDLEPADTATVAPGTLYHECKVLQSGGIVSHVTSGEFTLVPSINP
jgi:hypothetical protein